MTLGRAIDAYLGSLRGAEQQNTRRVYGRILRAAAAEFGGTSSGIPRSLMTLRTVPERRC